MEGGWEAKKAFPSVRTTLQTRHNMPFPEPPQPHPDRPLAGHPAAALREPRRQTSIIPPNSPPPCTPKIPPEDRIAGGALMPPSNSGLEDLECGC